MLLGLLVGLPFGVGVVRRLFGWVDDSAVGWLPGRVAVDGGGVVDTSPVGVLGAEPGGLARVEVPAGTGAVGAVLGELRSIGVDEGTAELGTDGGGATGDTTAGGTRGGGSRGATTPGLTSSPTRTTTTYAPAAPTKDHASLVTTRCRRPEGSTNTGPSGAGSLDVVIPVPSWANPDAVTRPQVGSSSRLCPRPTLSRK